MKNARLIRTCFVENGWWLIAAVAACVWAFSSALAQAKDSNDAGTQFEIRRGTNISHWLSQSDKRGEARRAWFTEKDVKYIASLGFDHIRLPADEEQLWDERGNKEKEAFELLHSAMNWCKENKLRVVVDLHILRSHHFNAKDKPLWTDPNAQERFLQLWRELSVELKKYPLGLVAYELMNEPVADDAEDWNELVENAIREIRKTEPNRKIVVGSNRWQSVDTFDKLRIPQGDRNIILSFHFYTPMLITHYKASWTGVGKYTGPVNYPGQIVTDKDMEGLSEEMTQLARRNNGIYNREVFAKLIQMPVTVARKYDLPLYCGEWGALPTVPREARMLWYADVRSVLEENNIAWANWDYKGGFGIIGRDGEGDEGFIKVLIGSRAAKDR